MSYPASSQYVTGIGGTEITSANDASGNAYWQSKGTSDEVLSLLQYIPEVAWNDNAAAVNAGGGLSATGGGVSTLYTTKPSWQTGVPGIPSDGKRDVPDISFYASPDLPGFLFCTSDTSDWNLSVSPIQTGSCGSGFRGSASDSSLTVAGGTSFSTPIFAGMVAVLNQAEGYTTGQGLMNPTLYSLAATPATYAAVFKDITTGDNKCPSSAGASYCSSASSGSYTTGTGYDLVTGLGSLNLSALVTAWPGTPTPPPPTIIGTTTSMSAGSLTPNINTNDVVTITVTSNSGTSIPTGNVTVSSDGCGTAYGVTGCTPQTVALTSNGTATYTANFTAAGVHTVVAQYAGDTTHAKSSGSISITIAGSSSGKGTFTLATSPSTVTISQGSKGTENLTITPAGGYTGTINLSFSTSNNSALTNLCVYGGTGLNSSGSATITGTTPLSAQIGIDTNGSNCAATGASKPGTHALHRLGAGNTSKNNPSNPAPLAIALAGLFLAGFIGRSSRKLRGFAAIVGLLALGLGLSACGGGSGSGSSSVSNPPKGTYTITINGTDSTTTTITAQTSFTLVIN